MIGVDAVRPARIRQVASLTTALLDPAEAAWVGADRERLAAVFAAKEATVKCGGGRWPGFGWQQITVRPSGAAAPCRCGARLAAVLAGLCGTTAGLNPADHTTVGHATVGSPVLRPCPECGRIPASWGRAGDLVIAVVTAPDPDHPRPIPGTGAHPC